MAAFYTALAGGGSSQPLAPPASLGSTMPCCGGGGTSARGRGAAPQRRPLRQPRARGVALRACPCHAQAALVAERSAQARGVRTRSQQL